MNTLYPEMQQVSIVQQHKLSDREIEHFIQKAGEFEYQDGFSRPEADKAAIALVLAERHANG